MPRRIRSRRVLLRDCDKLVIRPAELELADGRITRVTTDAAPPAPGVEARGSVDQRSEAALDLGDLLITPAFVNPHTHLALAFLRGIDAARYQRNLVEDLYFHFEAKLSPGDVRAFSRMGAYESLLAGVGLVWDHYYGEHAVAEALLDTGLSGVVAPTLQDLAGPGRSEHERALAATLEIADSARFQAAGVAAALGPHASDTVSPALLRQVAELAGAHDLPVHMHLAQSLDELRRLAARPEGTPLAALERAGLLENRLVLAHAIFCSAAQLARLAPQRHTLVFCPSSQLQFAFPADVTLWNQLGLRWAVATDCASSNDAMGVQQELRFCLGAASARATGSDAYQRFLASGQLEDAEEAERVRLEARGRESPHGSSTSLLARVWDLPGQLHPRLQAGLIAPGALANLLVWDTDHPAFWPASDPLRVLALGDPLPALHSVLVLGCVIGELGRPQAVLDSSAYRDAKHEADERLARLLASP